MGQKEEHGSFVVQRFISLYIVGMSTLLKDTNLTPMQEESMKMILASGDLLLAIVNDVLDYAKLETDHVELNVMKSDLQEMLQSILYSIEIKAKERGQSIRAIYDPYLPVFINTDIRRIQQSEFRLPTEHDKKILHGQSS